MRSDGEPSGPRFLVRTFGGLSVEGRDAAVPAAVNQRKRLAFLALLAAAGQRGIARERLLLLLWPESTTDRARGALYQLLYVARQAFGDDSVVGTDELRLDSRIVGSDVADFNDAIARGDFAAAADLYAGPFLDAVHLAGSPELERWVEQKRQELARSYQAALARLSAQAMERRDFSAAIGFAERLVAAEPLSERATVLLMDALAASGDVSAALERARIHASVVQHELGADVDASVSALAERLRSQAKVAVAGPVASETPRVVAQPSTARAPRATGARARRGTPAIAWAMAAVVIIGVTVIVAMQRPPRDRPKEFVVVAQFTASDSNSMMADMLTVATRRALSESRSLGAAPDERLVSARQRLRMSVDAPLTLPLARQLAIGDGIRSVVAGYVTSYGGHSAISLRLVSASTGEMLASVEQDGIAQGHLFNALDTLTRRLRERAGDDLEAIHAQPTILALTSSSLEAMTAYVTALRLPRDSQAVAVALLRKAVTLDTSFASAFWQLSRSIDIAGPMSDAEHRALLQRAWNHRDGLTDYERLRLDIAYNYSPNGTTADVIEHIERLRQVVERYPNAVDAKILADIYLGQRDLAAAEREYRLAIALDSTKQDAYVGVINTLLKENRIVDARRAADDFRRRFAASPTADMFDALVAYAEGRRDRARDIMQRVATSSGPSRIVGYISVAQFDLLQGRVAAWERTMRTKDSVSGIPASSPRLRSDRLRAKYWIVDRPAEGLAMIEAAVAADPSQRSSLDIAEYYAQFGAPDSARAVLTARGKQDLTMYLHGADTMPASAWIDLAEGRPREAARKFRESLRFSGGNAPSQTAHDAETGLAFERAGLADSAIATYEHYLKGPPSWEADAFKLVWTLEHVARLYDQKGDRRNARAAYLRIVELWQNADPELQPRVSKARERAEALR